MPIYEYYCAQCHSLFDHRARRIGQPPPPCPACGALELKKRLSVVHLGRSEKARRADFEAQAQQIHPDDMEGAAHLLHRAGSLVDEASPIAADHFAEVLKRRRQGVADEDMQDIVDDMPLANSTGDQTKPPGHTRPGHAQPGHTDQSHAGQRPPRHLGLFHG
ncbi:MAG: FmdB family zinc ribbon protein [Chloroflexota bacterium]